MAYVDLRERRDEERRREGGRSFWGTTGSPYVLLVAGVILAVPAVAASYATLLQNSPGSWVALAYWLPPAILLLWAVRRFERPRRRRRPTLDSGAEKLLLLAMRDAGGAITAATAALETPLTVDEADAMLSKLANNGHLGVESHDGALYYVLPLPPRPGPLGRR